MKERPTSRIFVRRECVARVRCAICGKVFSPRPRDPVVTFDPQQSARVVTLDPQQSARRDRGRPGGFTLVEVLVTVASLIIVLGLMASLARSVRRQASDRQTTALLLTLNELMEKYVARHRALPAVAAFVSPPAAPAAPAAGDGGLPVTTPPPDDALPDEAVLRRSARANNGDVVRALRKEAGPNVSIFGPVGPSPTEEGLLDAWGRDIVFMPRGHPAIGTALEDLPFFFSAGPDGRYRTLEDNVYSYEVLGTDRPRE